MSRRDAGGPTKTLNLRVQPRASRNEIAGFEDGRLKIFVTAPAEGGRANRLCLRLLAETLDIPPSRIEIIAGLKSRTKRVRIQDGAGVMWSRLPGSESGKNPP